MKMGTLEILATIFIAFAMLKLIVVLISPDSWLLFAKKIYTKPKITAAIAFILATIVLYHLINAGATIVQILAVTLFISLVIVIGVAQYANHIIDWAMERNLKVLVKEQWFYMLIWLILLLWGLKVVFLS